MIIQGWLKVGDYGDSDDVLLLDGEPLTEELDHIRNKTVTVRYWIAKRECTKEQAIEGFLRGIYTTSHEGELDAEWHVAYSDITGYLWTDEWFKVGGHDLLAELTSNAGRYLVLEVDIHDDHD